MTRDLISKRLKLDDGGILQFDNALELLTVIRDKYDNKVEHENLSDHIPTEYIKRGEILPELVK